MLISVLKRSRYRGRLTNLSLASSADNQGSIMR